MTFSNMETHEPLSSADEPQVLLMTVAESHTTSHAQHQSKELNPKRHGPQSEAVQALAPTATHQNYESLNATRGVFT